MSELDKPGGDIPEGHESVNHMAMEVSELSGRRVASRRDFVL